MLSASTSSSLDKQAHEHSMIQERLNDKITQLTQIVEQKSKEKTQMQILFEKVQMELTAQSQQLKDATALANTRKNELTALQADHSQTRIHLVELEGRYTEAHDRVKQLECTVSDLETRLNDSETERIQVETRRTRLISQVTQLETQVQQKADRIRELQASIDVLQQEQADSDRRLTVQRELFRQVESDWMQSRDQLAQTRKALTQAVQRQHETSLQLMRANFNYAQVTERLALAQVNEHNGQFYFCIER